MKVYILGLITGIISTTGVGFALHSIFSDVPEGAWYAPAIHRLSEKGIISGYGDGTFRPDNFVNRAELSVIIDNLIEYLENPEGQVSVLDEVQDTTPQQSVSLSVPFTAQAPHGNWNLPYQEACEEASIIMVAYFWNDETLNAGTADTEIIKLTDWEDDNDFAVDIDAAQTAQIAQTLYGLSAAVYYDNDVTLENIKKLLSAGYPVIIPAAGQILANPNYTGLGPPYHMIVLIGYDETGFIAHDPGTHAGSDFHYAYKTIDSAIHDWNGSKQTVESGRRAMVVLSR